MTQEPKNQRTEEPKNRMVSTLVLWFFGSLALFSTGCNFHRWMRREVASPPPVAFAALPSPMEAVAAVNANTNRVQTLHSQGASLSIPGLPSIGAEVAVERPRRLRVKA